MNERPTGDDIWKKADPNAKHKVRFVASDPFGGGNLRSFWPAYSVNLQPGYSTGCAMHYPGIKEYDTIVIHRPIGAEKPMMIQKFKLAGLRVLIDEDDDLTRVLETKNEIALQEWGPDAQANHKLSMAMADGVTVSSDALVEVFKDINPNIWVCRNYLPAEFSGIHWYGRDSGAPLIGWAGVTQTHLHDLEWIKPFAQTMFNGARFLNIGDPKSPRILGVPAAESHPFQNTAAGLYKLMSKADIGIVPLQDIEFNASKSYLKALEFMTVGVPCVVADFPEQRRLIEHGVDGFLTSDPAEFAEYVQLLVHNWELREKMSVAARIKARSFHVEDHADEWLAAIEGRKPRRKKLASVATRAKN